MIKSMTGFGRSEIERGNRKITVEIKSVNHRFLENSIKMPKKLNIFEARIRNMHQGERLMYLLHTRIIQRAM